MKVWSIVVALACLALTGCGEEASSAPGETKSVTLTAERDAIIRAVNGRGDGLNYGHEQYNSVHTWTNSAQPVVHRSLIYFDLSSIPIGAKVEEATLNLFADDDSSQYPDGHVSTSDNGCKVSRLTTDWAEMEVTWDTRPEIDDTAAVSIDATLSPYEEKHPDVTDMVATMLSEEGMNFGFQVQLIMESPYRRMVFASIDHDRTELHPTLTITYVESF